MKILLFLLLMIPAAVVQGEAIVKNGIDRLWEEPYCKLLAGKKVGLITNHTAVDSTLATSAEKIKAQAKAVGYTVQALFAPEHGINGAAYAFQSVNETKDADNIPIYSLYGDTKRPTDKMLSNITLLIFDIQDIGTRSYTYITTLFYAMEEAAKRNIPVMILDRPNPINGVTVDGPMLEEKWRSAIGYINIPYCHGMTVGELALFFNEEYRIGCKVHVVPMKGWKRTMSFEKTGLPWIPTSPYIPEKDTPFYYATTGILGELKLVNIGIGYTLPFKIVGAPWIDAEQFAKSLNAQKFEGVHFEPFHFRPFYGRYSKEACQGALILVTDPLRFKPVTTQYMILGILKSLYPAQFTAAAEAVKKKRETLCKLCGSEEMVRVIAEEKNIVWKLLAVQQKGREEFMAKRKKYLIKEYGESGNQ